MTSSNRSEVAQAAWQHFVDHGYAEKLLEDISEMSPEELVEVAWKVGFVQALLGIELGIHAAHNPINN